ncbi:MAG: class I SAM-dependent methyltransferase [Myxococcales bacterium]
MSGKEPMKAPEQRLGESTRRTTCRFCDGTDLTTVLDFGNVPLAGAFLTQAGIAGEKRYPLQLQFCRRCTLVQVGDVIPKETLFQQNYFFHSSAIKTLVDHFQRLAQEIHRTMNRDGRCFVVEIGCNDGVLLKPLLSLGVKCVGVDPARNVLEASGLPAQMLVNDFFTTAVASRIKERNGAARVVVSSYSFGHIDDMVEVMEGVRALLADDGVFIFEIYYLGIMLDELQYDMIYHEHMSYYTLLSLGRFLERFGMEIFDLQRDPLRAGTIRFHARKRRAVNGAVSEAVVALRKYEAERRLDRLETYVAFGDRVEASKRQLMTLLDRLKQEGRRIVGYGASGRASTIMNYCQIGSRHLEYVVDDAPAKHGMYTPGTHLLIRPWSAVEEGPGRPEFALLFAWSFIEEVRSKRSGFLESGGRFIVPLPEVRVVAG